MKRCLRWRTLDDGYAATTAEGWEYRVRFTSSGFSTDRKREDGEWECIAPDRATLQQAKFCAFSNARSRRWDALPLGASANVVMPTRCDATNPHTGERCGNHEGHHGQHTSLIASDLADRGAHAPR